MSNVPLRTKLQLAIYKVINPFVKFLIKLGFTPNTVTTTGLILNIGVAVIFIIGAEEGNRGDLSYVGWAGALILFAGLFDMLDGQVARLGKMSSTFGALYDSVLDRYSELVMFLGICYYLVAHHYFLSSLFAFIALIGSMMVSYTRARAEGLGIECKGGLMQRPERVVLVGVSAIACGITANIIGGNFKIISKTFHIQVFETMSIFTFPIAIMAVLTNITAIRRLMDAKKALMSKEEVKKKLPAKNIINILLLVCCVAFSSMAQNVINPQDTFPVPPKTSQTLFYLQRTPNANTVMYDLNVKNGVLDKKNPIHAYWIRYTEQKQKKELSFIERNFAYGMQAKPIGNDAYEVNFVSYKKTKFRLEKGPPDGKYHVYGTINNRKAAIQSVFIFINGGSTFSPNIEYVEMKGIDVATGKPVSGRIKI